MMKKMRKSILCGISSNVDVSRSGNFKSSSTWRVSSFFRFSFEKNSDRSSVRSKGSNETGKGVAPLF